MTRRSSRRAAACAGIAALLLFLSSRPAHATPQASAGLTVGGAVTDLRSSPTLAFHMGARAELVFGRESERDFGFGPYLDVVTAGFDTLEIGGGGQVLVPLKGEFLLGFSGGAFARYGGIPADWEPGVSATVHFWARSYNYDAPYVLANGAFVQMRYGFGDAHQADLIFGVQINLALLAIPFLPLASLGR